MLLIHNSLPRFPDRARSLESNWVMSSSQHVFLILGAMIFCIQYVWLTCEKTLPVRQVRVKISDNGLKILLWYSSKLKISVFKGSEINMSSILKMEALCSPKMLAHSQGAAWCNNPEGLHLHSRCCENLKSYEIEVFENSVKPWGCRAAREMWNSWMSSQLVEDSVTCISITPGIIGTVMPILLQLCTKLTKLSTWKKNCVIIKLAPASTWNQEHTGLHLEVPGLYIDRWEDAVWVDA
jgi:hypothetical protein